VLTCVLVKYYVRANKRKEIKQRKEELDGVVLDERDVSWGGLTDNRNLHFRYLY